MSLLAVRHPSRLALGDAAPRWRRSRSRIGRWVLAIGLAVVAAALVSHLTGQATETVAGWGQTRSVLVARHDLGPGRAVTADDVVRRDLPDAAVPASAVTDVPPGGSTGSPIGRVVTSLIVAGEVVSRQRLAPDGVQGIAALVPDGHRAVAVPTEGTGLALRVGDRVDVFAPGRTDSTTATRSDRADPVATNAVVVDVSTNAVTIAVDRSEVAALARALGQGTPVLALI
jgi:Flp pilus assembly protein CpaB